MDSLTSSQKKYLRGLAHRLKPVVLIGQNGLTDAVAAAAESALKSHELIKVKFVDLKDKSLKRVHAATLEAATGSCLVGMLGHTAVFFRRHEDPDKRKIKLPPDG